MTSTNDRSIKPNLVPTAELQRVADARRDVEQRLAGLKDRIESDLPFVAKDVTKNGVWAALALGLAAGLALAYRARLRRAAN